MLVLVTQCVQLFEFGLYIFPRFCTHIHGILSQAWTVAAVYLSLVGDQPRSVFYTMTVLYQYQKAQ